MAIFIATFACFGLALLGFAVGPLFGRRCVRGSCGGIGGGDCEFCPSKARLQEEMAASVKE